jgi:CheY-like chemotaxis protein
MAASKTDFFPKGKLKVLLAEDNIINQLLARSALENRGCTVDVAANGREALALLGQHAYDLILMDIQMPEMDGLEATKIIRQLPHPQQARIPIIALTANVMPGTRSLCLAAGMDGYLSKPYEESQLFHTIAQVLARPGGGGQDLPAAAPPPLYSLTHIRALTRDKEATISRMLQLFEQHTPRHLQDLQQNLLAGDWVRVSETAHNLKTSIDLLEITSLQAGIRLIEVQARQQTNLQQLPALVSQVVIKLEEILDQMRASQDGINLEEIEN